jgi:hypothetical protein
MPVALNEEQAVLLGDGRVLVVGSSLDATASTALLWDPATANWQTTGALNKQRTQFAMVPLADGRALVTGGLNEAGQSYSSTYIFEPRAGYETWSKVGLLGRARTSPTAALLSDGRVLVAGGYFAIKPTSDLNQVPDVALAAYRPVSASGGAQSRFGLFDVEPPHVGAALATAEIFDPATGNWSATGSLLYARSGANAITLADGRVLIVGSAAQSSTGVSVDGRAFRAAEIYDPKTGKFNLAGQLPDIDRAALEQQGAKGANPVPNEDPQPSNAGTLVALGDGGALLIGQSGWWKHVGDITRSFRFDAQTNSWSEVGKTWISIGADPGTASLETPGVRNLSGAMVAMLSDGRVLVAGGAGATPNGTTGSAADGATAESFDPPTATWSPLPPLPKARAYGVIVVLKDGSALLAGGADQETSSIRFVP